MKTTIKVGSDFSGVGAFNQALMRLGIDYQEVFACDMDKFARQTFIHNYGEPEYYPMNVYDREIPKESLDIYMTSPPCQAFSMAGKRLGKEDARGILFFNSLEFIQGNNPRFFIFENVKGLLSHDKDNKKDKIGRTFKEWIDYLGGKSVNGITTMMPIDGAIPYHLHYKVLNAKKHGVPQNRERVFLIGIRDDQDNTFTWPPEEELTKRLKDVLEDSVDDKYFLSEKMINYVSKDRLGNNNLIVNREIANTITFEIKKMQRSIQDNYIMDVMLYNQPKQFLINSTSEKIINLGNINPSGIGMNGNVFDVHGISPTLWSGHGEGIKIKLKGIGIQDDNYKIRRLTPRECFRLMDFPDTFTWPVSDSQAYKQAGNSIVVRVLEKIINNLPL